MSDIRKKVKDMITLALDDRGIEKERIAAALGACKLIEKHDLLASPFDGLASIDNEHVQAASSIFKTISDPEFVKSVKKVASGIANRKRRSR